MKIADFKEGDLITRVARTELTSGNDRGDGSYIGDKLEYVGKDSNTIIVLRLDDYCGEPSLLDFSCLDWDDDGWDYYPHKLFAKAQNRIKEILKIKSNKK